MCRERTSHTGERVCVCFRGSSLGTKHEQLVRREGLSTHLTSKGGVRVQVSSFGVVWHVVQRVVEHGAARYGAARGRPSGLLLLHGVEWRRGSEGRARRACTTQRLVRWAALEICVALSISRPAAAVAGQGTGTPAFPHCPVAWPTRAPLDPEGRPCKALPRGRPCNPQRALIGLR